MLGRGGRQQLTFPEPMPGTQFRIFLSFRKELQGVGLGCLGMSLLEKKDRYAAVHCRLHEQITTRVGGMTAHLMAHISVPLFSFLGFLASRRDPECTSESRSR